MEFMRSSCYHGTDRILKLKSQSEGDGSSENEIHCGGEQSYIPPMGRKVVFFYGKPCKGFQEYEFIRRHLL